VLLKQGGKKQVLNYNYANKPKIRTVIVIIRRRRRRRRRRRTTTTIINGHILLELLKYTIVVINFFS